MKNIEKLIREGEYKGVDFDVEIWVFETAEIMVYGFQVDGYPAVPVSDGHDAVTSLDEAFEIGAKLARDFIDRT
ncbi:hypothetical protein [Stenotrophomonas lacuserhaii]|uniref:hypothetical protein n=1 Tax=Stenotrophomonas lacuserhaii TaxID=2760084 RepID=UPI0015F9F0C8|nr:hypothetical protein [Stenotrophomonas lacuserhaii]